MTKTTTTNETAFPNKLVWTPAEMLEANFMFPVDIPDVGQFVKKEQYVSLSDLESDNDESFCAVIQQMLAPCQPLNNEERSGLVSSVHSGNRLRVLFHTLQVIERTSEALNATQTVVAIDEKDKETHDGRGFSFQENTLEKMDNQITSYTDSNLALNKPTK
jgi:hypothetical protein